MNKYRIDILVENELEVFIPKVKIGYCWRNLYKTPNRFYNENDAINDINHYHLRLINKKNFIGINKIKNYGKTRR